MTQKPLFKPTDLIATREAYGKALVALGKTIPELVVLDGEVGQMFTEDIFQQLPLQEQLMVCTQQQQELIITMQS
jgi:transketolase C-terminal domain/subunit